MPVEVPPSPPRVSARPFVGMVGLVAALFLVAGSGPVTPWWGLVLLIVLWLAAFGLACAWWTPHPDRLPWVAVGSLVIWLAVLVVGARWLGWG